MHMIHIMHKILSIFYIIILVIYYCATETYAGNLSYSQDKNHITLLNESQRNARQFPSEKLFSAYLKHSAYRHQVLSANIANLHTPKYKAQEVHQIKKYKDLYNTEHKKVSMRRTSSSHLLGGNHNTGATFISHALQDPYEVDMNGNSVSLPQQLTKISQNKTNYSTAIKAFGSMNNLVSLMLGK